jgi:hypothetical protein
MKSWIAAAALICGGLVFIAVIYCGALFVAHHGDPDFLSIDSCLGSGGKWNYTTRTCEH